MDQFHDEEILGKAYDSRLMRRLIRYLRPYRRHAFLAIALNIAIAALGPLRPYLTKIAIDSGIAKRDGHTLLLTVLGIAGAMLFQAAAQFFNAYYTQWIGQRVILDMRMQVFEHIHRLSLRFFDRNPVGRLVTRVTNDIEALNDLFSSGIVMVFTDIFTIIWILTFMGIINLPLTLVTLSVVPFLFYATFLFRQKVRESYRQIRILIARINAFMQEHITGMPVVQLFTQEKKVFDSFEDVNAAHRDANISSVFYYAVFYPSVDLISAIAAGLIIWYGGGRALEGAITVGVLISFLQYTEMFFRPIRDLSDKYNIMQTAMASSERVFKLLDTPPAVVDGRNAIEVAKPRGRVEFRNVWFAYGDDEWVLKNVSFTIEPGESVALVGHTGAGKSSIVNLLERFYDIQRGEIFVDGTEIRSISQESLRKNIAVVMQDVFLFSGDIGFNISLGDGGIDESRIRRASEMVGVHEFIASLERGYTQPVGERGSSLSTGQKQLVSFARALAHNPSILILDEATSSVDTETELRIQCAIETLLQGRTSIVVAHRLSTIQHVDRIIVLHKGEIREMGTHQELLALNGIYRKLYDLQYKERRGKAAPPIGRDGLRDRRDGDS
ncbi:MAG: antibiotic ABC transporter ATP-binding protein [Ignavibacteriales bacterium CG07_land_8_20_14_0_80_59_12]|nr:MAG: antibiotic ABC transporter ATP-binding protein [Ignavibacteriales bacterium CG07_land_8_20_14_0_80_59_12]